MTPREPAGEMETRYLQAVYELAEGVAKREVSIHDVLEYVALSEQEGNYCSDYWTQRGALEWPARGHVALTHTGLTMVHRCQNEQADVGEAPPVGQVTETKEPAATEEGCGAARVSIVIPVLNEAATVAGVIDVVRRDPRVLEVIVVDDGSIDGTPEVAAAAGATVVMSTFLGKGASMADGLQRARGEIVLFMDGDLEGVNPHLVEIMTDPILAGQADMVKARFTRDAGRVTVLTARPLLSNFFPELAGFEQPLGGIVAVRRAAVAGMRLEQDYGVDVAFLIDAAMRGLRVVEADVGYIRHKSQSLDALGEMAKEVTRVILDRAWRHDRLKINQVREREEWERRASAEVLPSLSRTDPASRFALFDMDGVLLDGRFVVEMAARVDATVELARFLDNPVLPNEERTRLIASLFVGVQREAFEEVAMAMPLMEGAVETILALRKAGYCVGIVTDSFAVAAEVVRRRVFADFCLAHVLHFRNGAATGEVALCSAMVDPEGCQVHQVCKGNVVGHLSRLMGLVPEETMAVGDSDNDACLLQRVGISVAFRPKGEAVRAAARYVVEGSLTEVLRFAPGLTNSQS